MSESAEPKSSAQSKPSERASERAASRSKLPSRRFLVWAVGPLLVFLIFTGVILTTGTPSSAKLMEQATASFAAVQKGVFDFSISITPEGTSDAEPSEIRLTGPFEILPGKKLPLAKINYTVSSGGRSQVIELLTTGDKAYTVVQGQPYELPASATKDLESATQELSGGESAKGAGGLSGLKLNFGKWLRNPQVAAGEEIDGTPTWRTRAGVDIVAALKDLTGSAQALGGVTGTQVPDLTEADLKELRSGIKNAKVEVFVGRYDRIVRKIDLSMDFSTPSELTAAAGGVTGGRLNVKIGIAQPNRPVSVAKPTNALPYKALQTLGKSVAQQGTALDDGLGK
ncbi:MAG: hypothetical protein WAP35_04670 [Solirubrobacterales bacterium]